MTYFITSNTNLLNSNKAWKNKFLNKTTKLDDYNKIFISLNNRQILSKYDNFIGVIYLNDYLKSNNKKKNSIIKSIILKNKNKNKNFFFLFYLHLTNNYQIDKRYKFQANMICNEILKLKYQNIFANLIISSSNEYFSTRNKYYLRCPFSLDGLLNLSNEVKKIILSNSTKPFKLIILDCDNTLWGGTIGEDRIDSLKYSEDDDGKIFEDIQKHLKYLKKQGFLISISSKNNEKDVWETFRKRRMQLAKKDFLFPKINWFEKYTNIQKILSALNLKEDDVLFIDDNKLEIDKIKKKFPKISVMNCEDISEYLEKLQEHPRLQKFRILEEDKKKYYQYNLKNKYENLKTKLNSLDDIYYELKQKIKILNINNSNINRTEQLFNKTNQFNLSTNRYNKNQLRNINKKTNVNIKLLSLSDKFGDHGIIGAYIYIHQKNYIVITDFLLSCRILSRKIEEYVIYLIHKENKNKEVYLRYITTDKNKDLVNIFLKNNSFKKMHTNIINKTKFKGKLYKILLDKRLKNVKKFF